MKKIGTMLLVGLLLFSVIGCAKQEDDVRGEIKSRKTESEEKVSKKDMEQDANKKEEEEVSVMDTLGKAQEDIYENEYLEIGFHLPTDWIFYTEEQINEMNGIVQGAVDEDMAKQLESAALIYDMMAANATGQNVNVVMQKMNSFQNAIYSEKEYVDASIETTKVALEQMGCTNINAEAGTVSFAGAEHAMMLISSDINGSTMYQKIVCVEKGPYIVCITATSVKEDITDNLLANFYALEK